MFRMRPVLFLELPCLEQRRRKFRTPLRSSPRGWPGSPTGPPARPRPRRPRPRSNNRQQAHSLSPPRSASISLSIDQLFPYLDRGSWFRKCRKFRLAETDPAHPDPAPDAFASFPARRGRGAAYGASATWGGRGRSPCHFDAPRTRLSTPDAFSHPQQRECSIHDGRGHLPRPCP